MQRVPLMLRVLSLRLLGLLLVVLPVAASGAGVGRGMDRYPFDDVDRIAPATEFAPWSEMMRRRAAEPFSMDACLQSLAACPTALRGARTVVLQGRALSAREQLEVVNRFVNRRRYVSRVVDTHWDTPAAFFRRGGDCEDYAIAKYFLLRAMGLATADLRIVVGRTRRSGGHHALLAVRGPDAKVLLLDTDDRIHSGERPSGYSYLYSVNEDAIWDHAGRTSANTLSPTAQLRQPRQAR